MLPPYSVLSALQKARLDAALPRAFQHTRCCWSYELGKESPLLQSAKRARLSRNTVNVNAKFCSLLGIVPTWSRVELLDSGHATVNIAESSALLPFALHVYGCWHLLDNVARLFFWGKPSPNCPKLGAQTQNHNKLQKNGPKGSKSHLEERIVHFPFTPFFPASHPLAPASPCFLSSCLINFLEVLFADCSTNLQNLPNPCNFRGGPIILFIRLSLT